MSKLDNTDWNRASEAVPLIIAQSEPWSSKIKEKDKFKPFHLFYLEPTPTFSLVLILYLYFFSGDDKNYAT